MGAATCDGEKKPSSAPAIGVGGGLMRLGWALDLSYSCSVTYVPLMPWRKRIWPHWARTVGGMIRQGAVVRVGCVKCRTFFDVDLVAVARARGDDYSLIDRTSQCKITRCRGTAYFIGAESMRDPIMTLVNASMNPLCLEGVRPIDLEPSAPEEPPPNEPARAAA